MPLLYSYIACLYSTDIVAWNGSNWIGLEGAGERANAFDALLQKKLLRCLSLIRLYSPLFTLFTSVLIVVALGQSGLTNGQFRGFITNNVFVFVSFWGAGGMRLWFVIVKIVWPQVRCLSHLVFSLFSPTKVEKLSYSQTNSCQKRYQWRLLFAPLLETLIVLSWVCSFILVFLSLRLSFPVWRHCLSPFSLFLLTS